MSEPPRVARVLLVGMMGAGKTTLGHELSASTGWPYLDNDELVRRATGVQTPQVLDEQGVAELRRVESLALTQALVEPPPVIVAVAGGVVEDPADRERLRQGGFVVWLRARLDTLAHRVGSGTGRPWLRGDPAAALQRLYDGRAALYEAAASYILDVDDRSPAELAREVLAGYEKWAGTSPGEAR